MGSEGGTEWLVVPALVSYKALYITIYTEERHFDFQFPQK